MKSCGRKSPGIFLAIMTTWFSVGTALADTPLFFPSERDFASNSGYAVATNPTVVDLDGDGDLDIVVGYEDGKAFRIFGNDGDGTYKLVGTYATQGDFYNYPSPSNIVAADLDGDGDLDLAAGTRNVGVELFLNQGSWKFEAAGTYEAGTSVVASDMDNDGDTDLVTDGVYLLINDGKAVFAVTPILNAEGDVTVADFTGDGNLDIATSGSYGWPNQLYGSLLVNDGTGSFSNAGNLNLGGRRITSADFDNDGDVDLAIVGRENGILLNNGSGTFTSTGLNLGSYGEMTVSDFNGDGVVDLALGYGQDIYVYLSNGDGTFNESYEAWYGCGNTFIGSGDVDGDGDVDIILAERGCGEIGIVKNNGDGTFSDAISFTDTELGSSPYTVAVGDMNGDGINDMTVGTRNGVMILFNRDGASFDIGPVYGEGANADDIVVADFDGDGDLDVATNNMAVFFNDGKGALTFAGYYDIRGWYIAAVDVDGDNDLDLMTSYVEVLVNDGSGNFSAPVEYPDAGGSYWRSSFQVADFNGDGRPDVAATSSARVGNRTDYYVRVSLNDGSGEFPAGTDYKVGSWDYYNGPWEAAAGLAVGDVDHDGDIDIALGIEYQDQVSRGRGSKLRVLENDGNGNFSNQQTFDMLLGPYAEPYNIESGDFNGDGKVDFALTTCYHVVIIALNNGDGTFYNGGMYSGVCGDDWDDIETGDLNMDGITDYIVFDRNYRMDVILSYTPGTTAAMAMAKSIIAEMDALIAGGVTDAGLAQLQADLANLEEFIRAMIASGRLENGEGQRLLASVMASSASIERAIEGKGQNASNMVGAGRNQLAALVYKFADPGAVDETVKGLKK